jgi:hypothetical protein
MKYIRTTDGDIYETKDLIKCEDNRYPNDWVTCWGGVSLTAIKESDNIEELCDEFVWVTPEGEHHIKPKTGDGLWYLCCDYKKGHQIYGAIWTDIGLIYIAKLTEKGWKLV